jgi:ABC-2 type transport system ATP-binding protein
VDELSKGMQQKVQIAGTLLHEPSILVVDEPFTGLDPINIVLVKEILRERSRAGGLVVLSSHQMPMVEALCDRVALIHEGRLVLYGDLEEIRRRHGGAAVLVASDDELTGVAAVERLEREGPLNRVYLKPGARPRDLMDQLVARRIAIEHFEVVRTPLEEIFVRTIRSEAGGGGA